MARGTGRSAMGLQVHSSIINKRVPIQPSLQCGRHDTHNHQNMATHLYLLPELREKALIRNLAAKQRAARKYNANLCPRSFISGDVVGRMTSSARKKDD